MQRSKSLIIGLISLVLIAVLVVILLLKDSSELVSIKQAQELIESNPPQKIIFDRDYLYFDIQDKRYRVNKESVLPMVGYLGWDFPIESKNERMKGEMIGELGILIVILLGLAVLFQAFKMIFNKNKDASPKKVASSHFDAPSPLSSLEQSNNDALVHSPLSSSVTFKDVAGISEVKEELFEIIDYLKNTKKYQDLGIKLPKGVLLIGPPGVGKTMIAKAVAGEAGVPFFYQSGSSFVQIYVGMGAKRVRDLFLRAKSKSPSIIFIDEIDAVGKARGNTRSDEREATLNQLLTEMDGFEDSSGVIIIGATNKIEVLDEALLRSGRFDRRIYVELPDLNEREHIFEVYLQGKSHRLDVKEVARLCVGFSGAAIASLVNESALNALRRKSPVIELEDILATKDKVLVGKKKRLSFSEKEKEILATYQSAKALSAYWLEVDFDKISLIADSFKEIDKELVSKTELVNKIKVALAGNIAVEMMHHQIFSNAQEDIAKAKEIATQMCEQYGMAERLMTDSSDILVILESAKKEMSEFLSDSKPALMKVAKHLLAQERLSKEEIKTLIDDAFER
ncbi:AAA family ATPase [Helicobacter sp. MIT 05-5293]|uniref:AAA family ATPase n=1 Tax=Helicobacter sp. MIT 05-5293 TaxID=1548149 RepID=UPI00051D7793|nr:AAA family ATPase [Helicobacter sp. MIT 05-5293]TLD81567.1 AAA family ATPase [Helicobacter sp. MIT 05-5293]